MISSRNFHDSVRRSVVIAAGIVWVLCLPYKASAQDRRRDSGAITCASDDGRRVYCDADTRGGVRLVR